MNRILGMAILLFLLLSALSACGSRSPQSSTPTATAAPQHPAVGTGEYLCTVTDAQDGRTFSPSCRTGRSAFICPA